MLLLSEAGNKLTGRRPVTLEFTANVQGSEIEAVVKARAFGE